MNDINSLSHTRWNCKYHIVFAPKYRRKVFYKEKRREVGKILRELCEWKKIKNSRGRSVPGPCAYALGDTAEILRFQVSWDSLKGKSSLMLYERFPELKYKYRNREFWCRGYYVDTAGKNTKRIAEYIKHQLDEDQMAEQMTMGNI